MLVAHIPSLTTTSWNPSLNNNKLESIHGQKYLCGSSGIQVGDCQTPMQSKNEESYFGRKSLTQASNLLTSVLPIDAETTLSP